MAKKYTDIGSGTPYTDNVILVANATTGALRRVTVAQLLAATGTDPGGGGLTQLSTPTLTATVISSTEIDLSWTNVANESSYALYWSPNGSSSWTQIGGTIAANTVTYNHTGLTASTLYYYRVKAVGDGVTYSDSNYGTDSDTTSGSGYDTDAQAYFDVLTAPSTPFKDAVNTFIVGLKTDSIWSKVEAGYILMRGSIGECKWNWKNPADTDGAFRLLQTNTVTFTSTGATASNLGGLRTNYYPAADLADTNSVAIGMYINGNSTSGEVDMGFYGGANDFYVMPRNGSDNSAGVIYDYGTRASNSSVTDSSGFWMASRETSSVLKLYRNGSQQGSTATGAGGSPPASWQVGVCNAVNSSGATPTFASSTARELKFAIITNGLNATEVGNLSTRVATLMAAI